MGTKTVLRPPTFTVRSGLRALSVNSDGTCDTRLINRARSMWTRVPFTSAPAAFHMTMASSSRNSQPTSSRIFKDSSWISSTASSGTIW